MQLQNRSDLVYSWAAQYILKSIHLILQCAITAKQTPHVKSCKKLGDREKYRDLRRRWEREIWRRVTCVFCMQSKPCCCRVVGAKLLQHHNTPVIKNNRSSDNQCHAARVGTYRLLRKLQTVKQIVRREKCVDLRRTGWEFHSRNCISQRGIWRIGACQPNPPNSTTVLLSYMCLPVLPRSLRLISVYWSHVVADLLLASAAVAAADTVRHYPAGAAPCWICPNCWLLRTFPPVRPAVALPCSLI